MHTLDFPKTRLELTLIAPDTFLLHDHAGEGTDRIAALGATSITGCHTPVIRAPQVADAIAITRGTCGITVPPQPDQAVFDQIQLVLGGVPA